MYNLIHLQPVAAFLKPQLELVFGPLTSVKFGPECVLLAACLFCLLGIWSTLARSARTAHKAEKKEKKN